MAKALPIYLFGEVLFDCFPGCEPQLGGAPFNVAWHLQAFGAEPQFISSVGDDEPGREIAARMNSWQMSTRYLQTANSHPTGQVAVSIEEGEPQYDIVQDVAYDHIAPDPLPVISDEHLFYHGTLVTRSRRSLQSLLQLRESPGQKRFIDVNLRSPWWSRESVLEQVYAAHCVKLNQDELSDLLGWERQERGLDVWLDAAIEFKLKNNITNLIVTRGGEGSFMIENTGHALLPDRPLEQANVVDTVGAGDAFSSVLLLGMMHQWDWLTTLERAQAFAAFIVGQRGAVSSNPSIYRDFKCLWSLL